MLNSVTVLDSEGAVSGFTMSAPMIQAMATALMHAGLCLFFQYTQLCPTVVPLNMIFSLPGMLLLSLHC